MNFIVSLLSNNVLQALIEWNTMVVFSIGYEWNTMMILSRS